MVTVTAIGDACPLPVGQTIRAIKALQGADTIEMPADQLQAHRDRYC